MGSVRLPRNKVARALSLVALVAVLFLASGSIHSQAKDKDPPPDRRLRGVVKALEAEKAKSKALEKAAATLDVDMRTLRDRLVDSARVIQKHELDVSILEQKIDRLLGEERRMTASLAGNYGKFSRVLLALSRIARFPPEAIVAQTASPSDTIRSALLLRTAVPRIEKQAADLKKELAGLLDVRGEISRRHADLAEAAADLRGERRELDSLLTRKVKLRQKTKTEIKAALLRIQKLAGKAETLRDLLVRLEEDRQARQKQQAQEALARKNALGKHPPIRRAKGRLAFPAAGRITARYGEPANVGTSRKGVTLETIPGAQVVAPYGGEVVYAGKFRGYGQLLIIRHSDGYHTLLAGLGRIDSIIGQSLTTGEPVGVMGTEEDGKPALYFELRRKGRPINPLPWLAAHKGKDSG